MQQLQVEANGVVRSALVGANALHAAWEQATCGLRIMQMSRIPVNDICQNAAITTCASSQWRSSVDLFASFRTCFSPGYPTVVSYTALMTAFNGDFQLWQWPCFLLLQLHHSGLKADPYCTAVAGDSAWELSIQLFAESNRSEISYNIVTDACGKYGKWEHAMSLLKEMLKSFIAPSASTFATVMNACGNSGHWRFSVHLLDQMSMLRIQSTAASSAAAMSACSWNGRWEVALHLFVILESRAAEFDAVSHSALISAFERGSRWQLALEHFALVQSLQQRDPPSGENDTDLVDTVMYNCLLSALQKGSQWQSALENLGQIRACALQIDDITCNVAISACEASNRWEIAVGLARQATSHGLQQDEVTYNAVISCLDTGQQWPLALHCTTKMTFCTLSPSSVTLDTLAHALRKEWKVAILQLERTRSFSNLLETMLCHVSFICFKHEQHGLLGLWNSFIFFATGQPCWTGRMSPTLSLRVRLVKLRSWPFNGKLSFNSLETHHATRSKLSKPCCQHVQRVQRAAGNAICQLNDLNDSKMFQELQRHSCQLADPGRGSQGG